MRRVLNGLTENTSRIATAERTIQRLDLSAPDNSYLKPAARERAHWEGGDSHRVRLEIRPQRNLRFRIQTPNPGVSHANWVVAASLQARVKQRRCGRKSGGRPTSLASRAPSSRTKFPRGHGFPKLLPVRTAVE